MWNDEGSFTLSQSDSGFMCEIEDADGATQTLMLNEDLLGSLHVGVGHLLEGTGVLSDLACKSRVLTIDQLACRVSAALRVDDGFLLTANDEEWCVTTAGLTFPMQPSESAAVLQTKSWSIDPGSHGPGASESGRYLLVSHDVDYLVMSESEGDVQVEDLLTARTQEEAVANFTARYS